MAGGVYPGGVSRKELEQRIRQLQNQLRQSLSGEVREQIRIYRVGESGSSSSSGPAEVETHVFTKSTAATLWTVNHNLGRYPAVTVLNSAGEQVFALVKHLSEAKLTVEFTSATAGKVLMV